MPGRVGGTRNRGRYPAPQPAAATRGAGPRGPAVRGRVDTALSGAPPAAWRPAAADVPVRPPSGTDAGIRFTGGGPAPAGAGAGRPAREAVAHHPVRRAAVAVPDGAAAGTRARRPAGRLSGGELCGGGAAAVARRGRRGGVRMTVPDNVTEAALRRATATIGRLRERLAVRERADAVPAIAVVGMACRFPGGADDPDRYWDLLRAGRNAVAPLPRQRWAGVDFGGLTDPAFDRLPAWAGVVDGVDLFDADFFGIGPDEAAAPDPQQ